MPPMYSYKCPKCQKTEDKFNKMADHKNGPECCGEIMRQHFTRQYVHGDFAPYWDENLGEKPVYVESKQHRKKLMKDLGLSEKYGKGWV